MSTDSAAPAQEIELKFHVPGEDVFNRLLALDRVGDFVLRDQGLQRGEDVYVDTADPTMNAIDGLRDVFVMSLSNRSLRRMLDHVFGQAHHLLHVDAMAVFASFTLVAGQPHPGKVIYASDDSTSTLLAARPILDSAVLAAIAQGQRHVFCVNEALPGDGLAMPAAWLVAPMQVNNDIIGIAVFLFAGEAFLPAHGDEVVASLAEQAMVAYGADRLQRLAGTAVALHERERLAREMHDAVMQSVYSLTLFAEAGRRLASMGQIERVEENLQMLSETAQQALSEMRLLLYELKPAVLEQAGLIEALRQRLDAVERRTGMIARVFGVRRARTTAGTRQKGGGPVGATRRGAPRRGHEVGGGRRRDHRGRERRHAAGTPPGAGGGAEFAVKRNDGKLTDNLIFYWNPE